MILALVARDPGFDSRTGLLSTILSKCFTSRNKIDFFGFLKYWLFGWKELNDRAKEDKQRQDAKKILYSHAKALL